MIWLSKRVVRAGAVAGLLLGVSLAGGPARAQDLEPVGPVPGAELLANSVDLLRARDAGLVQVELRGDGEESVRLAVRNVSPRRLGVVVPPGLIAASVSGQFQSMGLGQPTNRPNSFGEFSTSATGADTGAFSSVAPVGPRPSLMLAAGQTVEVAVPAVCLNFGLPEPTPRDGMVLMDVAEFTPDVRAQRALRALGTLGTSRNVAQAVAWNVFNGVPFRTMVARAPKSVNGMEAGLASRFIDALDQSSGELVDPAYITEGRVFVRVQGEGDLAEKAETLARDLEGLHVLGLPTRVVTTEGEPQAQGPALYLVVTLTSTTDDATAGRVAAKGLAAGGGWSDGGTAKLMADAPADQLDPAGLVRAIDEAVARQFVAVKKVKRVDGGTLVRVENRLPFTMARVVLEVGPEPPAPVTFDAMGVSPLRSAEVMVPAAEASIGRVEFNGL